jgi:SMC interacting uncharacterized protein involved in chromosome segregation
MCAGQVAAQVEVSSDFINNTYDYVMMQQERIRELEAKNAALHCDIHDYNSLVNRLTAKVDSLTNEIVVVRFEAEDSLSAFKATYAFLFIVILVLLVFLMSKRR